MAVVGDASAQRPDSTRARTAVDAGANLVLGKRLFDASCARCHGIGGAGDLGPPLARADLRGAPNDTVLRSVILGGIPGSSMPGAPYLSEADTRQIVAYVRSLGRAAAEPLAGDADRGGTVYARAGCVGCHTLSRVGGVIGPELTNIGLRRSATHIRQSLEDPAASLAADGGVVNYLVVRVVTSGGRAVTGVRLNEDGFTIQLREADGRFHSFRKSALRKLEKDFKASVMPTYHGQIPARDLDDLVAYLATRRDGK